MNKYTNIDNTDFTIAIVDGYGAGKVFARRLKQLGYSCVHIQSMDPLPKMYAKLFHPEDYLYNIIYTGEIGSIINKLKTSKVKYIIAALESGVELADLLSEKMQLLTNGTKLSVARRDKFEMIETIKKKGLRTVEHFQSNNLTEISNWCKKYNKWPVVLKPPRSALTEKVYFCHSPKEIEIAFNEIINTHDVFNNIIDKILVESFLQGEHYLVNTVSSQNQHRVSDIWICEKRLIPHGSVVFENARLIPYNSKHVKEIIAYTFKLLDALGIKYGGAHTEIIFTNEGPVVVESAARMMGLVNQHIVEKALRRTQLSLIILSYLDPQKFILEVPSAYEAKQQLIVKIIISNQEGFIKKINFLQEIKNLKSYRDMVLNYKVGSYLKKTTNLFSIAGVIYLLHKDSEIIENDYSKILEFEKRMFDIAS